jgi:hypothetical protein
LSHSTSLFFLFFIVLLQNAHEEHKCKYLVVQKED